MENDRRVAKASDSGACDVPSAVTRVAAKRLSISQRLIVDVDVQMLILVIVDADVDADVDVSE
jgi:hypothetical protein